MDVGRRIREVREDLGMPVAVLARRIGVAPNTVARLERNETEPHMSTLRKLASALDVKPADLVKGR